MDTKIKVDTEQVSQKWHALNGDWQELERVINTAYWQAIAPFEENFQNEKGKLEAEYAKKSFLTKIWERSKKKEKISKLEAKKESKIEPIKSEFVDIHDSISEVVYTLYGNAYKNPDAVAYTHAILLFPVGRGDIGGGMSIYDKPESEIIKQNAAWEARFKEIDSKLKEISTAIAGFSEKYCSVAVTK